MRVFPRVCVCVGMQASSCMPEGMQKRMTTVLNHAATGCQGTACEFARLRGRNGPLGLLEQIALMLSKHTSPSFEHLAQQKSTEHRKRYKFAQNPACIIQYPTVSLSKQQWKPIRKYVYRITGVTNQKLFLNSKMRLQSVCAASMNHSQLYRG